MLFRSIQRKLALGYTIIVALIGGIVYTYLHEWRQMNRLEREVKAVSYTHLISSLTDEAIRAGMSNLKDGEAYNSLYHAADCFQHAAGRRCL